jgi:tetratricopeptide (TPR) repeat protein
MRTNDWRARRTASRHGRDTSLFLASLKGSRWNCSDRSRPLDSNGSISKRENILAAHAWCLRTEGGAEQDYRLVHAIRHYWFMRGQLNLGYRVTKEAAARVDGGSASVARCKALWVAGQIGTCMGRYAEAQHYLQQSLSMAKTFGDRRMEAAVLSNLALAALGQGDRATARRHCEEALELAHKSGNKRQIASSSNALAQVHRLNGDLDAAEPLYQQCRTGRELGDSEVVAVGLLNLAMVAMARGRAGALGSCCSKSLRLRRDRLRDHDQSALEAAAGLAAVRGEWEHAALLRGRRRADRFHGRAKGSRR